MTRKVGNGGFEICMHGEIGENYFDEYTKTITLWALNVSSMYWKVRPLHLTFVSF